MRTLTLLLVHFCFLSALLALVPTCQIDVCISLSFSTGHHTQVSYYSHLPVSGSGNKVM